jgi:hypothetical protein
MSVDFQRTTRRYVPKDRSLHNHRCENLKSYTGIILSTFQPGRDIQIVLSVGMRIDRFILKGKCRETPRRNAGLCCDIPSRDGASHVNARATLSNGRTIKENGGGKVHINFLGPSI